ncbi:MAG TPA: DUF6428 family protein [Abditibacteriaceae bacterium]|jgi:hypothetical protein
MKLREFKSLLEANSDKQFQIVLPNHDQIPMSFHITEVGQVNKVFIDCGGKIHSVQTCQLQVWVGEDEDHRLNSGKIASILKLAQSIVPHDDIDIEIEYEDNLISQYPIEDYTVTNEAVTLYLTHKHTDCLAKELCVVPSGCGTKGCC